MEELSSLFAWKADCAAICHRLRAQHQGIIVGEVNRAMSELVGSGNARPADASQLLGTLPHTSLASIIDAPETCYQVDMYRKSGDAAKLIKYVAQVAGVEMARNGHSLPGSSGWSAAGDCYIPGEGEEKPDPGWLEEPSRPYLAPQMNGIPLDYVSPYAVRRLEQNNFRPDFRDSEAYSNQEKDSSSRKILSALASLEGVGGEPYKFVTAMVRTIMPRPEPVSGLFSGSSNRGHLGRVNLFNPHLEYISKDNVANSLVHEAVHIFLYMIEQRFIPSDDRDTLYNDFIESPWSGKKIHLLAYIHASFVWYSLFHFWSLEQVEKSIGGNVRDHYLTFTTKGFTRGEMLSRLNRFRSRIRPALMLELEKIQEVMLPYQK